MKLLCYTSITFTKVYCAPEAKHMFITNGRMGRSKFVVMATYIQIFLTFKELTLKRQLSTQNYCTANTTNHWFRAEPTAGISDVLNFLYYFFLPWILKTELLKFNSKLLKGSAIFGKWKTLTLILETFCQMCK